MERPRKTTLKTLYAALILVVTSSLAYALARAGLSESSVVMTFVLGVLGVTLIAGRTLGVLSAVLGVLIFNFLFTAPRFTLTVYDSTYLFTFAVMLVVTLTTSTLTGRIQKQAREAAERERRTRAMYEVSRSLLQHSGRDEVARNALDHLRRILDCEVTCYFSEGVSGTLEPVLPDSAGDKACVFAQPSESNAAQRTIAEPDSVYPEYSGLSRSRGYYVPLKGARGIHGVLGLLPLDLDGSLPPEQFEVFRTFAALISLALDRETLARDHERARLDAEGERLKSTLLRSISHDLRTPLSGISGAASALLNEPSNYDSESRHQLVRSIYEESTWLSRVVENLLSLTRLEGGGVQVTRQMEVVDEVVASAIEHSRSRLNGRALHSSLPGTVSVAPMDARLMEQVLVNLIDNAVKHTPDDTEIHLDVVEREGLLSFTVRDNGPGIPAAVQPRLFELFTSGYRGSDSKRGVGLGLAICKTIVEAHEGRIAAWNADEGGAVVQVELPMKQNDG